MAKEIITIELDDAALQSKLNNINKSLNENNKAVAKNNAEIKSLTETTKALDKAFKSGSITADEYNEEVERTATAISRVKEENRGLSTENRKLTTEQRNLTNIQEQQVGSLNRLRAELNLSIKQFDALSREQRENKEVGGVMQLQIERLTTEVTKAEQATGRFQRQVGNYSGVGKTFTDALKAQGGALGGAITGVQGFNAALKTNPLLAVLTVLIPLISSFKQLQPVIDLINEAMGAVSAVMDVVVVRASKLVDALKAVISLDFSKASDNLAASVSGVGKALAEAAESGANFAKTQKLIGDENDRLALATAKADTEISKLIKKLSDRTLSEEERLKVAQKITEIEEKNLKDQLENARLQLTSNEERLKLLLKEKEVNVELLKTTEDLIQAAKDYEIEDKIFQDVTKAAIDLQKVEQSSLQLTERVQLRKNAILEEEKQAKEKAAAQTKAKLDKEKALQEKHNADLDNLFSEFNLSERQRLEKSFEDKLELLTGFSKKEIVLRAQILKAQDDALKVFDDKKREEKFQEDLQRTKKEIEADFELRKQGLLLQQASKEEFENLNIERQLALLENEKELRLQNFEDIVFIDNQILELKQQYSDRLVEIEKARIAKSIEQSKIERDAKISFSKAVLDAVVLFAKKGSALGKAAALASIAVDTGKAIAGAIAAAQSIPFPGNLAAMAVGVSAVLTGIVSARQALKSAPDIEGFATGGIVTEGIPIRRSNGDNVLATLKTGEVVLNKAQQRRLGGASTFRAIGVPGFASGGITSAPITSTIDSGNSIAEQVSEAIENMQIFTAITDINKGQSNFAQIVERSQA